MCKKNSDCAATKDSYNNNGWRNFNILQRLFLSGINLITLIPLPALKGQRLKKYLEIEKLEKEKEMSGSNCTQV